MKAPQWCGGTNKVDIYLTTAFRNWGKCKLIHQSMFFFIYSNFIFLVCTRRPWITLSIAFAITAGLSSGFFFMQITTDPVELWAAPHSRSRIEKQHFDKTFGPFFRNEQIFIKPKNTSNVLLPISILFAIFK